MRWLAACGIVGACHGGALLSGFLHCHDFLRVVRLPPLVGCVLFTWGALLDFTASSWLGLLLDDACGSRWLHGIL